MATYQAILPSVKNILQCLICFNMPFTIVKGMFSVVITFLTYKHISPDFKKEARTVKYEKVAGTGGRTVTKKLEKDVFDMRLFFFEKNDILFLLKNRRPNPLLLHGQSHFASQNKEA